MGDNFNPLLLVAAIALGAITGGIGFYAVQGTFAGIGGALFAGALLGGIGYLLSSLFAPSTDIPTARATVRDVQLNVFSRVSRVPVVYGYRRVGGHVLQLGEMKFEDVNVGDRLESHLFGTILFGVCEGRSRRMINVLTEDNPVKRSNWDWAHGSNDESNSPWAELEESSEPGRNLGYMNTTTVLFDGDLGLTSGIPNFSFDVVGLRPSNGYLTEVNPFDWLPRRVGYDGPTTTVWYTILTNDNYPSPTGMIVEKIPAGTSSSGSTQIWYVEVPEEITTDVVHGWYLGIMDTVFMQDPNNPRDFYYAPPSGANWRRVDLGAGFDTAIVQECLDDRSGHLHTLHQAADGTWYVQRVSLVQLRKQNAVLGTEYNVGLGEGDQLPGAVDFTDVLAMQYKPEDKVYWMVVERVAGHSLGDVALVGYSAVEGTFTQIVDLEANGVNPGDVIGLNKLGAVAYLFKAAGVDPIRISISDGTVVQQDWEWFVSDLMATTYPTLNAISVTQSCHSYMGVVLWQQGGTHVVGGHYGPRPEGARYTRLDPIRRALLHDAENNSNPTWVGPPALEHPTHATWVSVGKRDVSLTPEEHIANGAMYRSIHPDDAITLGPFDVVFLARSHQGSTMLFFIDTSPVAGGDSPEWYFTWASGVVEGGGWNWWWWYGANRRRRYKIVQVDQGSGYSTDFIWYQGGSSGGLENPNYFSVPYWDLGIGHLDGFSDSLGEWTLSVLDPLVDGNSAYYTWWAEINTHLELYEGWHLWVTIPTTGDPSPPAGNPVQPTPVMVDVELLDEGSNFYLESGHGIKELFVNPDANGEPDIALSELGITGGNPTTRQGYEGGSPGDWIVNIQTVDAGPVTPLVGTPGNNNGCRVTDFDDALETPVQDPRATRTPLTVSSDGRIELRHWQLQTTPAAILFDMWVNDRYGCKAQRARFDLPQALSLHGFSNELVDFGGTLLRRYIFNAHFEDAIKWPAFKDEILSQCQGYSVQKPRMESFAFESGDSEPIIHFTASMMATGTFTCLVRSPKKNANKVVARFWNATDRVEDTREAPNEFDIDITGEVREQSLDLKAITDPLRAHYIATQALEGTTVDRLAVQFSTGVFAAVLDPGDVIAVDHPKGLWIEKAFRIVSIEHLGEGSVAIEAVEVSEYTVDDAVASAIPQITPQGGGGLQFATSGARDVSIEHFQGRAMEPFRVAPIETTEDGVFVIGQRAPRTLLTASVTGDIYYLSGGGVVGVHNHDSAVIDDDLIYSPTQSLSVDAMRVLGVSTLPATAYVVKQTGLSTVVVQDVTLESITQSGEWDGSADVTRGDDISDVTSDTEDVDAFYLVTGMDEPVNEDGSSVPAQAWDSAGTWVDKTTEVGLVANLVTMLVAKRDCVVIGVELADVVANTISFVFDSFSDQPMQFVVEYSCAFDASVPLAVWKALTYVDTTNGFTQDGMIQFQIPATWNRQDVWDRSGNKINPSSPQNLFWIRIQRRSTQGSAPVADVVQLKNLPTLHLRPPVLIDQEFDVPTDENASVRVWSTPSTDRLRYYIVRMATYNDRRTQGMEAFSATSYPTRSWPLGAWPARG